MAHLAEGKGCGEGKGVGGRDRGEGGGRLRLAPWDRYILAASIGFPANVSRVSRKGSRKELIAIEQ